MTEKRIGVQLTFDDLCVIHLALGHAGSFALSDQELDNLHRLRTSIVQAMRDLNTAPFD